MKDVFISHSKTDKGIAKKLTSKLEASGVSCCLLVRDKEKWGEEEMIKQSRIFVLILSSETPESETVARQLKLAVSHNLKIVPFKTDQVESSLGMNYLLDSLEWVDPQNDGFEEATDTLLEIIEETKTGKYKQVSSSRSKTQQKPSIKTSYLWVIIGILSLALIYLAFFKDNSTAGSDENNTPGALPTTASGTQPAYVNKSLNDEEKNILGTWRMTDYEDSRTFSPEEKAQIEKNIALMKQNVALTFKEDRTFIRKGFTAQPQYGYWLYNANKKQVALTPSGTNQQEYISIMTLTETDMVIVVTEVVQLEGGGNETVTTKISFKKI